MAMEIFNEKIIRCDGSNGGKNCNVIYHQIQRSMDLDYFAESAMRQGWVFNSKTKKWYCPKCANQKQ